MSRISMSRRKERRGGKKSREKGVREEDVPGTGGLLHLAHYH